MKRSTLTIALAWLLGAACTHAVAQTPAGAADPQAPVPATIYRPAVEYPASPAPGGAGKTVPPYQHHAGMEMEGMQCMAGCCCCGGTDKADAHASHAGMAMKDGSRCQHDTAGGQPAACQAGNACGCCGRKEGK